MKGPPDRKKVVVRHLPPSISQVAFAEQIDTYFEGRYSWLSFSPGKSSQKHQTYARAYIDFIKPEDVFEFAEFFNGHVFVNEKGTQFKAIVEFAPCQRVPKQLPKKDGREGTIVKDPDYLEFLEAIAKPVESLPSAEVQLDRREAERTGASKDVPVITPLMDFVRQKRAAKNGPRRIMPSGKPIKDARIFGSPSSGLSRRGSEKGRVSNKMYVKRDTSKSASSKEKSTYTMVAKQDDELDQSIATEGRSGTLGSVDTGKKILLLKGKEKEISLVSGGMPLQQSETSKTAVGPNTFRRNQQREASGRIIRSILLNKDARQSQSSTPGNSEQPNESSYAERDRRPPRPQNLKSFVKDTTVVSEEKFSGNDMNDFPRDRQDRRTRYKDRPDQSVWTPLRRSGGSHASNESLSSSNSQGPYKPYRHSGGRGMARDGKESDGSFRRGGSSNNSHEKQVWVQKSSAGS